MDASLEFYSSTILGLRFTFRQHTFKTNGKRTLLGNVEALLDYEPLEIFAFAAANEMAEGKQAGAFFMLATVDRVLGLFCDMGSGPRPQLIRLRR